MPDVWLVLALAVVGACFLLRTEDGDIREMDGRHGLPIRVLTGGPGPKTHLYPTCRSWNADGTAVWFEQVSRVGTTEDGRRTMSLWQADVRTGRSREVVSYSMPRDFETAEREVLPRDWFHADSSPAGPLVYFDDGGHRLFLMDSSTGKRELLWREEEGVIREPPSISRDGRRVSYYASFPLQDNRWFEEAVYAIFTVDVEPASLRPLGEPRLVHAFPRRRMGRWQPGRQGFVFVNHVQLNPADADLIGFAHERRGMPQYPGVVANRIWTVRVDGSALRPSARQDAESEIHTHEVFGPLGRHFYFVSWKRDLSSVCRVDLQTGEQGEIFSSERFPNHISVSPDERWVVADDWLPCGRDEHGNPLCTLTLARVKTGEQRLIACFPRGEKHPFHPHPAFSPDGTKVVFTLMDGADSSQVAVVDVSDYIRQLGGAEPGQDGPAARTP